MATHYSPKGFLRNAPNALLEQYFGRQSIELGVALTGLSETNIDPIYEAWQSLPPDKRTRVESDFRDIDTMANENGIKALLEEAAYHREDLVPVFAPMGGFHDKAFWCFLKRRRVFDVALQFVSADNLSGRYWRKRKGVPRVPAAVDESDIRALGAALSMYFRERQGRGQSCTVECYKRGDEDWFFAFPEDYGMTSIEYEQNKLERRPRKPAFEVVFVYSQTEGTLDTYFQGRVDVVRELQRIFGKAILRKSLPNEEDDKAVYELDALGRRGFHFAYGPESGIEGVRVKSLRFTNRVGYRNRITLETASGDPDAIYDLVEEVFWDGTVPSTRGDRIPLSFMHVTDVGIAVTFAATGRKRRGSRAFTIKYPNACTLKEEGRDLVIRRMLVDSGLEPTGGQLKVEATK